MQAVFREKTGKLGLSLSSATDKLCGLEEVNHSELQFPHLENGNNAYFADSFDNQMN